MSHDITRIIARINSTAWAILPEKLEAIQGVIERRMAEGPDAAMELEGAPDETSYLQINPDGIAVISIMGTMGHRLNVLERFSGGISTEIILRDLERTLESDQVKGILLHIDSPGGMVDGTKELADYVAMIREVKPVVAYTDGMMASAAYWVGSAAHTIVAYPTAQVGSIGVVATHIDRSGADAKKGIKRSFITNGRYKRIINDAEPLSDEGRAYMQDLVDQTARIFIEDVGRNRGVSPDNIAGTEARVYLAQAAQDQGLVDRVASFNQAYTLLRRRSGIMDRAELKTDFPELFNATFQEGKGSVTAAEFAEMHPDAITAWQADGAKQERQRIIEIREAAFDGQEDLVNELIEAGVSADDARRRLILDQKSRMEGQLQQIRQNDPGDVGANPAGDPVEEAQAASPQEAGDRLTAIGKNIAADKGVSFAQAFDQACRDNPQLAKAYNNR
jgi:capsid assembly protease